MQLILDTNQVDDVARSLKHSRKRSGGIVLVLPLAVICERILGPSPQDNLSRFSKVPLRFGMLQADFFSLLARSSPAQLPECHPLHPRRSREHALFKLVFQGHASGIVRADAKAYKEKNRELATRMCDRIKAAAKASRDAHSRGEQLDLLKDVESIDALFTRLASGADSGVAKAYLGWFAETDDRFIHPDTACSYWLSLCRNKHFYNAIRMQLCAICAYGAGWRDSSLNSTPSEHRDDIVDTMLPMYARDGDIILTKDKMLTKWISCMCPDGKIRAMTWSRLLKSCSTVRAEFG